MRMTKRSGTAWLVLGVGLAFLGWGGCSGDAKVECIGEACDLACEGPGCEATCAEGADCQVECTDEDCTLDCASGSTCDLDCGAAGNCNADCEGQA